MILTAGKQFFFKFNELYFVQQMRQNYFLKFQDKLIIAELIYLLFCIPPDFTIIFMLFL